MPNRRPDMHAADPAAHADMIIRANGASVTHPVDPAAHAARPEHPPRVGFFTDTSICIGCKACEVA
jgi:hypothetical protein